MTDGENRARTAARGLRLLATLTLVLVPWLGSATSVAAARSGYERFPASVGQVNGSSSASTDTVVDIALITRDPDTADLLTGTCYVLVDASNEGCDENGDGQVTFAAIPPGTYTVHQTRTPAGYPTIDDYDIHVDPVRGLPGSGSFGVPLGFIVRQAPDQNAPDTRNVSVVLLDMRTHERVVADVCVELVGASNVGCDEDLRDGQIDFIDVPAGGPYELRFSDLPPAYEVATVGGPLGVTIDAGPGEPSNRTIFVLLAGPGGDAGATDADAGSNDVGAGSGDADIERTESAKVVGADGFTLALDGVTVSGAAGAAPVGTAVRARRAAEELPDDIGAFADSAGAGVEVTLGDGLQPASPLTITFSPREVAGWDPAADPADDLTPVVFTSAADGLGMELADARLLPDGSVVVTADHLSRFQPALVSISAFSDWFGDQVLIFMGVRSDRPDCVDQVDDDGDWAFSAVEDDLLWPCLAPTADGLEVSFTGNSPEVWLVESDQATPYYPSPKSITSAVVAALAMQALDRSTTSPVIPPDSAVTFATDGQTDPLTFRASLNKPLTIAHALFEAISTYLPAKKLEALGEADCLIDAVPAWFETPGDVEEGDFGGLTATIFSCLAEVADGLAGTLISSVTTIPGAVTALVDTVVRHFVGADAFTVTLSRSEVAPVETPVEATSAPSPASGWPTDRNDSLPGLYVWLGANFYHFPDWVACDDARDYCLVGYTGEEHMLVRVDGLDVVATIPDDAANPRQELLALGLPEESVNQILGT